MFTSHKQISPPSLVLKLKISEVSQKWIPKAVELKRIPTHKKCKCKKFCSQTRLVGEIYSSDVIMHRGYLNWSLNKKGAFLFFVKFVSACEKVALPKRNMTGKIWPDDSSCECCFQSVWQRANNRLQELLPFARLWGERNFLKQNNGTHYAPCKVISRSQNSADFCSWNVKFCALESGIHSVEFRIQDCLGFPYMGWTHCFFQH